MTNIIGNPRNTFLIKLSNLRFIILVSLYSHEYYATQAGSGGGLLLGCPVGSVGLGFGEFLFLGPSQSPGGGRSHGGFSLISSLGHRKMQLVFGGSSLQTTDPSAPSIHIQKPER